MRKIRIFDTTLRDGEQSPGCSMNIHEKLEMARQLERLGVDVIEAGFPIASPEDFESVQKIAREVQNCQVAALCRAVKGDIDCAWEALKGHPNPLIHIFLATSDIHLESKLNVRRGLRGEERQIHRRGRRADGAENRGNIKERSSLFQRRLERSLCRRV